MVEKSSAIREKERCANCQRLLGLIETPYVWKEAVVCAKCYGYLSAEYATNQPPIENFAARGHHRKYRLPRLYAGLVGGGIVVIAVSVFVLRPAHKRLQILDQSLSPVPRVPRQSKNPSANLTGSISGTVWLTRDNGSSDKQLGLVIQLIKPTCHGAGVRTSLETAASDWDDIAKGNLAEATKIRADFPSAAGDSGKSYEDEANDDRKKAVEAREAAKKTDVNAEIDLASALSLIEEYSPPGAAEYAWLLELDGILQEARTGADGTYAFDRIPPGSYYVHTEVYSRHLNAEWYVPVVVQANVISKVDLYNQNAASIHDSRP
ncbi:MAG TPA: hypothetical protein VFC78_17240 [Tepidisphaeraceae bacterium]|nr:hypothetical protein [Tepidisphaeraceae bacterium]